jgi:hypothetical protein
MKFLSAYRRPLLAAGLPLALLLGACHHNDSQDDDTPVPKPVDLKGKWQRESSYYKYTDAQGNTTQQGGSKEATPYTYLTISETLWNLSRSSQSADYFYSHPTDSTYSTYYFYQNLPVTEKDYSILSLEEHKMVTRYVYQLVSGGRFIEKETFLR